jgi:hypothetical protein
MTHRRVGRTTYSFSTRAVLFPLSMTLNVPSACVTSYCYTKMQESFRSPYSGSCYYSCECLSVYLYLRITRIYVGPTHIKVSLMCDVHCPGRPCWYRYDYICTNLTACYRNPRGSTSFSTRGQGQFASAW